MEEFILSIAEKSMIGAGFFYLLRYLVKNMEGISDSLNKFGSVLQQVSDTLIKIDMRVGQLEERMRIMERRD